MKKCSITTLLENAPFCRGLHSYYTRTRKAGMKKLTTTQPFPFEGYLVMVLHQDWIQKFNAVPTLDVFVDDEGHLCLVSRETIKE